MAESLGHITTAAIPLSSRAAAYDYIRLGDALARRCAVRFIYSPDGDILEPVVGPEDRITELGRAALTWWHGELGAGVAEYGITIGIPTREELVQQRALLMEAI